MENDIASILFSRGIMPDDFISYSTYAAVAEIVKENKVLFAKVSEQEKLIAVLDQQLSDEKEYWKGIVEQVQRDASREIDKYRL